MVIRAALSAACVALLVACAPTPQAATGGVPPSSTTTAVASTPARVLAPSEPTEVRIPRIDVRSSLVPLGLNADETVEVPPIETPMQAGWYRFARTPGEPGPAVILGHVDGNGLPGIFFRLRELVPGDQVEVSRSDGSTAVFAVRKVEQIAKDEFPTDAVYGDTTGPELRLITCGGAFDEVDRNYRDNIIVYATIV